MQDWTSGVSVPATSPARHIRRNFDACMDGRSNQMKGELFILEPRQFRSEIHSQSNKLKSFAGIALEACVYDSLFEYLVKYDADPNLIKKGFRGVAPGGARFSVDLFVCGVVIEIKASVRERHDQPFNNCMNLRSAGLGADLNLLIASDEDVSDLSSKVHPVAVVPLSSEVAVSSLFNRCLAAAQRGV